MLQERRHQTEFPKCVFVRHVHFVLLQIEIWTTFFLFGDSDISKFLSHNSNELQQIGKKNYNENNNFIQIHTFHSFVTSEGWLAKTKALKNQNHKPVASKWQARCKASKSPASCNAKLHWKHNKLIQIFWNNFQNRNLEPRIYKTNPNILN